MRIVRWLQIRERLLRSDKLAALSVILEKMIVADEDVTARNVARASAGDFKHASDITRQPDRRALLAEAQSRQASLRKAAAKLGKSSPVDLAARLEAAQREIAQLKAEKTLLISAVRAAILSIGRLGGMRAWREYFPAYSEAFEELRRLDALPPADVTDITHGTLHSD